MAENLQLSITVEAWAEITIKEWIRKIEMMGIGENTGDLIRSFSHHVNTSANGDPEKIIFAFEYYGNFVSWGVGNGVTIDERDSLIAANQTTRRQKPWKTEVFSKQLTILKHLLEEKYARKGELLIVNTLKETNHGESAS